MFTATVEQQVDPSTTASECQVRPATSGAADADDLLVLVLNVSLVSGLLLCNANIVCQACVGWENYDYKKLDDVKLIHRYGNRSLSLHFYIFAKAVICVHKQQK